MSQSAGRAPEEPVRASTGGSAVMTALVVMPHPDDADTGAGGTIARWVAEGVRVTYCLVTDGSAGGGMVSPELLTAKRAREQDAAARVLGVAEIISLGYPDGEVEASVALRREIARLIRRVRPVRVLAPTPVWNLDTIAACHPDHLAVGAAVCHAVYPEAQLAEGVRPNLEGLAPHFVEELWLMSDPNPNRAVDITEWFEAKVAAVQTHESQFGTGETLATQMAVWAATAAARWNLGPDRLAEEFRVLNVS